jgi:hypothetical protein
LRAWKNWHAEELEEALAGPHRHIIEPLVALLKHLDLQSIKPLLNFSHLQIHARQQTADRRRSLGRTRYCFSGHPPDHRSR